jgi:hypothetical protein
MKFAREAYSLIDGDTIYDCLACGKMFSEEYIDAHLHKCPKMDEHIAKLEMEKNNGSD